MATKNNKWQPNSGAPQIKKMKPSERPFSKLNIILIGACGLLILVGFLFMLGGGSSPESGFNPDIFSTRRIVVGPLLAFLGFLFMAFAILINPDYKWRKKSKPNKNIDKDTENGMA